MPPSEDFSCSELCEGKDTDDLEMKDELDEAGVPPWESCSSSSLILSFIDSKSINVLSADVDALVELSGDGVLLVLAIGAGAIGMVWPGIGCGLVS